MAQFTAEQQHDGKTVAAVLRAFVPDLSWGEVRKSIGARRVTVNEVICVDDARRIRAGDRIELAAQSARPLPDLVDVRIVHQDQGIVVIDKPAGMECERRSEQSGWSKQKRSRQLTVVEAMQNRGFRVFPTHRLDRDTSGLMLYPLSQPTYQQMTAQFAGHAVQRTYVALAIGVVPSVTVRNWIIRDRGDGLRGCVDLSVPDAQEAVSHIKQVEVIRGEYTLLECRLETGRTHQIRLHLSSLGHPICGEKLYRTQSLGGSSIADNSGATRQMLHSASLSFLHPSTGQQMQFQSPLPPDLERLLNRLRQPN